MSWDRPTAADYAWSAASEAKSTADHNATTLEKALQRIKALEAAVRAAGYGQFLTQETNQK